MAAVESTIATSLTMPKRYSIFAERTAEAMLLRAVTAFLRSTISEKKIEINKRRFQKIIYSHAISTRRLLFDIRRLSNKFAVI